jgi:peptidoglycan/xylan/chitin deacetylase (PgdA/CDA1 family)
MSSVRQIARHSAASAFYSSGGFRRSLKRRAALGQVCVLGLHRVLSGEEIGQSYSESAIVMRTESFEALCAFLARYFEVVPLSSVLRGGAECHTAKPRCVITFDDGWEDNYFRALPILQRFGFPATIFLATSMLDSNTTFWIERIRAFAASPEGWEMLRQSMSARLGKRPQQVAIRDITEHLKHMSSEQRQDIITGILGELPQAGAADRMLSWQQVRKMSHAGVEFASHTHTHPLLPYEPREKVGSELLSSQEELSDHGVANACAFAYPNGAWNDAVRNQVREAGYTAAATTQPGWFAPADDAYSMRRVLLHEGSVIGPDKRFSPAAAGLSVMGWR